jgi:hypothetical protein
MKPCGLHIQFFTNKMVNFKIPAHQHLLGRPKPKWKILDVDLWTLCEYL